MSNFSMHFNEARGTWIAKVKLGGEWRTKYLPKAYQRTQQVEAEQWLIQWYGNRLADRQSEPIAIHQKKTLKVYGPKWLELRGKSKRASPNYTKMLISTMNSWILDSQHSHYSIENLDLEKDFTVQIMRQWIESLPGKPGSRLNVIGTLRNFFADVIAEEWLDPEMFNPLMKMPIKKLLKEIRAQRDDNHHTTALTADELTMLLTHRKPEGSNRQTVYNIPDFRRLKYLVGLGTGLRDNEIHGLTWGDLHLDEAVPFVDVNKQVLKSGKNPALRYETLVQSLSAKEIIKLPNAVLKNPKFNSKRIVPLHPSVVEGLKWWHRVGWRAWVQRAPTATDPVFPRDHKIMPGAFATSGSAELFAQDLMRVGIERPLVFHALRHTFSSLLDQHGISDEMIGAMLGHKATTTLRKNYIAKHLPTYYQAVQKLPLPLVARGKFGDQTEAAI